MDDYSKFLKYSSSSNEITLFYKLVKYIPGCDQNTPINLNRYENEFGSNVKKQNFSGYITISKSSTLGQFKQKVSEMTGFPLGTMVGFGYKVGKECDENGKEWNIVGKINYNDNMIISQTRYDSSLIDNRDVYIYIDIKRNQTFSYINDNQILNDKVIDEIKEERKEDKKKMSELEIKVDELNSENEKNKRIISKISKDNRILTEKNKEEEDRKRKHEKDKKNCKDDFEKEKHKIKNEKVEGWKKKINEILIKDYINEFERDEGKKKKSTISFLQSFKNFTDELIKQSENYNKSFEQHSKKIIEQFDPKKNNISIKHINLIVIGPAGVGKSAFINQSLLLDKNKRALEGTGESVTSESHLYTSEKLTMVRIWDTQGLDFERNPETILNEIKNLVNNGLQKGPDFYINIILYCTNMNRNRFQKEEGKLIKRIMELYPCDNLPVIINILQAYFPEDAKNMEISIRQVLSKYLEKHIVEKIEIKSVVARKKESQGSVIKAFGIPELLKCSFDKMGQAIASATSKKFSEEIEGMCQKFVEDKLKFINKICHDEFELLDYLKSLVNFDEDDEDYIQQKNKRKRNLKFLSISNIYRNSSNFDFVKNFSEILNNKFKQIYINLNGNLNNNFEKPYIFTYIEGTLKNIQNNLQKFSLKLFEDNFKTNFQDYSFDLQTKLSELNERYNTNNQIKYSLEKENFKKELFGYYQNQFYKIYLCIIIKLFKENMQKILEESFKRIIKENEKSINLKAEAALKNVTERLKEKLLKELELYYPKENKDSIENKILPNPSELSNDSLKDDFEFTF